MLTLAAGELMESYRRDGYLFPLTAMSTAEAAGYRRRLSAFEAANPTGQSFREIVKAKAHLLCLALLEIVRRREILDAVEHVLGPDILCWSTGVFLKEAGDPAFVSWHQDVTYWGLAPHDVVTAWVALSPATVESGAMHFLPGSHIGPIGTHTETFARDNLLSRGQTLTTDIDETQAVDVVLQPGQFSLHHIRLAHGSRPNRSDDRRIGIAIRYMAPHVRQVGVAEDSALLVRGTDEYRHFAPDQLPTRDYEPWALALSSEAYNRSSQLPSAAGLT